MCSLDVYSCQESVSSATAAAEKVMDIDENDMKQLLLDRQYAFAEAFGRRVLAK